MPGGWREPIVFIRFSLTSSQYWATRLPLRRYGGGSGRLGLLLFSQWANSVGRARDPDHGTHMLSWLSPDFFLLDSYGVRPYVPLNRRPVHARY